MNIESLNSALFSVFSRTFTGQIQPAYHYLEFFPEIEPFLLGRSMTNPEVRVHILFIGNVLVYINEFVELQVQCLQFFGVKFMLSKNFRVFNFPF